MNILKILMIAISLNNLSASFLDSLEKITPTIKKTLLCATILVCGMPQISAHNPNDNFPDVMEGYRYASRFYPKYGENGFLLYSKLQNLDEMIGVKFMHSIHGTITQNGSAKKIPFVIHNPKCFIYHVDDNKIAGICNIHDFLSKTPYSSIEINWNFIRKEFDTLLEYKITGNNLFFAGFKKN